MINQQINQAGKVYFSVFGNISQTKSIEGGSKNWSEVLTSEPNYSVIL